MGHEERIRRAQNLGLFPSVWARNRCIPRGTNHLGFSLWVRVDPLLSPMGPRVFGLERWRRPGFPNFWWAFGLPCRRSPLGWAHQGGFLRSFLGAPRRWRAFGLSTRTLGFRGALASFILAVSPKCPAPGLQQCLGERALYTYCPCWRDLVRKHPRVTHLGPLGNANFLEHLWDIGGLVLLGKRAFSVGNRGPGPFGPFPENARKGLGAWWLQMGLGALAGAPQGFLAARAPVGARAFSTGVLVPFIAFP